jgi:hypothetical protein
MCEKHNGYKNYPTWNLACTLENNEKYIIILDEIIKQTINSKDIKEKVKNNFFYNNEEYSRYLAVICGKKLKDNITDRIEYINAKAYPEIFNTLINSAIAQIDFTEIIEKYRDL